MDVGLSNELGPWTSPGNSGEVSYQSDAGRADARTHTSLTHEAQTSTVMFLHERGATPKKST